jgi:DNA-directed RNA polymerase specialized sigma24 family protein
LVDIFRKRKNTQQLDESKQLLDADDAMFDVDEVVDEGKPGDQPPDGYARLRQKEKWKFIEECRDKLKSAHRQLLYMDLELEMSVKEIANSMDIPEGTVKSGLHYAKALMRKCLELRFQGEMR